MKFSRDICIIDIETTGLDHQRHEIIQLASVRLDKNSLKEIDSFSSYIRPNQWNGKMNEAARVHKISFETLKSAPNLAAVLKKFTQHFFPQEVILGNYGGTFDFDFLKAAFRQSRMEWQYDYHAVNVWSFAYAYLAKINYKFKFKVNQKTKVDHYFTGFRMDDVARALKINILQTHDALDDCRLEAEVLRRIVKKIKP